LGNQDDQGCAVGVILVAGVLDGVGCVQAGIDNRKVRLFSRAAQFVGAGLSKKEVAVDFLFGH